MKWHLGFGILVEYDALTSASYVLLLSTVEPPTNRYVTGNTVRISQFSISHMLIGPVKNYENQRFSLIYKNAPDIE